MLRPACQPERRASNDLSNVGLDTEAQLSMPMKIVLTGQHTIAFEN